MTDIKLNKIYKTKGHEVFVKILHVLNETDLDFIAKAEDRVKNLPVLGITEHGQFFVWERDGSAPTEFNVDDQMDLVEVDYEPQKIVS